MGAAAEFDTLPSQGTPRSEVPLCRACTDVMCHLTSHIPPPSSDPSFSLTARGVLCRSVSRDPGAGSGLSCIFSFFLFVVRVLVYARYMSA